MILGVGDWAICFQTFDWSEAINTLIQSVETWNSAAQKWHWWLMLYLDLSGFVLAWQRYTIGIEMMIPRWYYPSQMMTSAHVLCHQSINHAQRITLNMCWAVSVYLHIVVLCMCCLNVEYEFQYLLLWKHNNLSSLWHWLVTIFPNNSIPKEKNHFNEPLQPSLSL